MRLTYELVVAGRLGSHLAGAVEGFAVVATGGDETRLRGPVDDQETLHRALRSLQDLGVEIVEIVLVGLGNTCR